MSVRPAHFICLTKENQYFANIQAQKRHRQQIIESAKIGQVFLAVVPYSLVEIHPGM
jgi:hypothetical protein